MKYVIYTRRKNFESVWIKSSKEDGKIIPIFMSLRKAEKTAQDLSKRYKRTYWVSPISIDLKWKLNLKTK